jgi:hypothetical protein
MKKYMDIVKYVVFCGTMKQCLLREKRLRPKPNMGWNIAEGGGMPPSPKGKPWCVSKLHQDKRGKVYVVSEESRAKMRASQRKLKKFQSERMTGDLNPMKGRFGRDRPNWKGWYITPRGIFENAEQVSEEFKISLPAVMRRCKVGGKIGRSRYIPKEWVGKTWESLGWDFKEKK